jgi:hypothetical protein
MICASRDHVCVGCAGTESPSPSLWASPSQRQAAYTFPSRAGSAMPARWTLLGTSNSRSSGAAPRILEPDGRARHVYFPDRDVCQQQRMLPLRFHVAKSTVEPRECATGGLGRLYLIQNAGGPSHGTVRDAGGMPCRIVVP